jgi:hypothetical protein
MPDPQITTPNGAAPVGPAPITRDRRGLLDVLEVIDAQGWDSEPGTALLAYARHELVRPLTIDVGLRGAAASQAEATAWEAVWLKLCDPYLRSARSPWGVVWQTARRAVLGEVLAARWATNWRRAWEHDVEERAGRLSRPYWLGTLLATPDAFPAALPAHERISNTVVSDALDHAAGALADCGWSPGQAKEIVGEVAAMDVPLGRGATVIGWRPLATRLGLPPWQARRLTFVLRGSADRPGLLARLIREGPHVTAAPEVREALATTRNRTLPTPTRQVQNAQDRPCPQRTGS